MRVILVIDWAYVSGGQTKVAFDSARALKARGHEPIIFSAVGPIDPTLVADGIPVHCLHQHELPNDPNKIAAAWRGIDNRAAARGLHKLLQEQPRGNTVVHVHGWAKALSASIAGPIRAAKHPVIYTMHEFFLICPNGGFYNYRAHEHCTLTPFSPACIATHCDSRTYGFKLWRTARLAVARFIQRLPAAMHNIAYFHPFQRAIMEQHVPASAQLYEIPNPVESEPMGQKEDGAAGELIYLGRLSEEKGVFLYASAMRKAGLTPVFVGDGPAKPALQARFPESRFLGWHDAKGVRQRLREARALVFPSLWYEGQPLTVLESLSVGTPVIVSDGCAGRESVRDGETGLWFRRMDEDDLTRALRVLMRDEVARSMSEAAYRRYWDAPFSIERHCDRLEEVYGEMLAREAA